jgi:hypothetical protein
MISRTLRRHLLRGLAAASVAALTTSTAVATVGAPSELPEQVELPAVAVEAPADTEDAASDSDDDATDADADAESLEATSTGAEMRSDTADAVQDVITSTPPEERGREFGAAVADAASNGRAGGPEADGATADDVDTSDEEDDVDTSDDDVDTSDEDDVDTSDDLDTDVDPADAADDKRRDGDHRPS